MSSKDPQLQIEMAENPKDYNDIVSDSSHSRVAFLPVDEKNASPQDDDALNFTINIYQKYRIRIYKPLILLKVVLFLWFGGASFTMPFLIIYLKQFGITLSELSTGFILSPFAQFFGTLCSGLVADKFGRSKPVLLANLILTMVLLCGIILVPRLNIPCSSQPINLKCHPRQFDRLITKTSCDVVEDTIEVKSCNVQCPENVTDHCTGRNLICEIFAGNEEIRNFSLSIHVTGSYKGRERCFYNVSSMSHENETYSWCNVPHKMNCRVSCTIDSGEKCSNEIDGRDGYVVIVLILFILFMTTVSNVYRILDVTSMSLVKEHDSDFGRERFFSIAGILVVSPIAGYIVSATTPQGAEKRFTVAFYVFLGITAFLLVLVYFLKVRITSPGKKMWKKALHLMKNADVVSFVIVVFILGTAFSFTKNFMFWYLEGMNATSLLIGLIPAVSSLYGLPFLVTSKWWVEKIGSTQIFVIGLLGYVVNAIGYSFLTDPWFSLILEATNILTYHLLWVAVVLHSHELAPEGLTSTVIATAGSIHYHIGKSSGSLIGGLIMDAFDGPTAFRVMGIICLVSAVLYGLYIYVRRSCFKGAQNPNRTGDAMQDRKSNDIYPLKEK